LLERRELEALELHVLVGDGEALDLDVVADEHGLVLDDRVRQAEVALDLGHRAAGAEVLEVHVDAALLLADVVGEPAAAPRLDLGEASGLAADDLADAPADALGGVGVDVGPQDVNGLVFARAVRRGDGSAHEFSSWPRPRDAP